MMNIVTQLRIENKDATPIIEEIGKICIASNYTSETTVEHKMCNKHSNSLSDQSVIRQFITQGLCVFDYKLLSTKDAVLEVITKDDCIVLEFVLEEKGRHNLSYIKEEEKLYTLSKDIPLDLFLVCMSTDFYLKLIAKIEILYNEFAAEINQKVFRSLHRSGLPLNYEMKQLIAKIRNCTRTGSLHRFCLELKLQELLLLQFEQHQSIQNKVPVLNDILHPKDQHCIEQATLILIQNYNSPPTIGSLAKMVGINESKLKCQFKKMYHCTIHDFVVKQRMEQAFKLIKTKNIQIKEIASEVGYKNPSHFSAAFKKYYGYLPTEFSY